jgi:hypothetical protein
MQAPNPASRTVLPSRTAAPLDERIYQEGDLSKAAALPHDLGLTRLQHADSALLLGRVPGNATQKDFIRRGQTLRPLSLVDMAQRVRTQAKREAKMRRNRFNYHSYDAALELDREIARLKAEEQQQAEQERHEQMAASRAGGRGGGASAPEPAEIPHHPQTIPESEAVRGSAAASVSAISRMLAARAGAPLVSGPEPAHHFYAGGSSSQLRKERRRQIERQRLAEANLELRKQQLVDRNLEVLADMGEQEAANAQLAAEFVRATQLPQGPPPVPLGGFDGAEEAGLSADPATQDASTGATAASGVSASTATKATIILGTALAVGAAMVLAGAVLARRK